MEAANIQSLTFAFMDLPGEIRNEVYARLLVLPYDSHPPMAYSDSDKVYPQILAVCRKVHAEALPLLYGSNTFIANPTLLSCLPRLTVFYPMIQSSQMVSLIRKYLVRVRLDCMPNYSYEAAMGAFSGVDELTIEVFQAQFRGSRHEVLTLFEGV
jgi:hypothetical protein